MRKVHFIVFYKDSDCISKCVGCIDELIVPEDVETDVLGICEGESITEAYEAAMRESDADIKIYVRENVYITDSQFLNRVLNFMGNHHEVAMAGIVGGFQKNAEFIDWTSGSLNICNEDRQTCFVAEHKPDFEYVDFLTGHVLITQKDFSWPKNEEGNDRYFDIIQSKNVRKGGSRLAVINFDAPSAIWENGKAYSERFDVYSDDAGAWAWMPKERPLVSVVSVTHNSAEFVSATVESVLEQTYENIQFVVTDDCSTDTTVSVLGKYAEKDSRMVVYSLNRNRHACFAENNSFEHCNGEYLAMLGHDDLWRPWKLEEQISVMEHDKSLAMCFTHTHIVNESLEITDNKNNAFGIFLQKNITRSEWVDKLFWNGNCLCAPSAVIRSSFISRPLYKLGLLQVQDYDLWLRLLLKGNLYIVKNCMTLYRQFEKTTENLSYLGNENGLSPKYIRTLNETQFFKYQFVMSLSEEEFRQLFEKHLINADFSGALELLCEKAFVLYKAKNRRFIETFNDILESQGGLSVLEQKYNTSLLDFYEMETQFMW